MPRVRIIPDPLDHGVYREVETPNVLETLRSEFPAWPPTGRVYRTAIGADNDVTPRCEADLLLLDEADGEDLFYVVVYPGDPITAIITIVATIALTAAVLLFLTPKIPKIGNNTTDSSNNALGNRINKPRPNERIPDIFGTVAAVPELLTVPITTYLNNVQVEVSYMCVGRGSYLIEDVRDGGTPLILIAGAGAEFYAPGTSPNSGVPQLTVGTAVDAPFRSVYRMNEVNGQKFDPPNANSVTGSGNIRFVAPNYIENNGGIDFTQFFGSGDDITVVGADFGGGVAYTYETKSARFKDNMTVEFATFNPSAFFTVGQSSVVSGAVFYVNDGVNPPFTVDFSGTYTVVSVNSTTVGFAGAGGGYSQFYDVGDLYDYYLQLAVQDYAPPGTSNWSSLTGLPGGATAYQNVIFGATGVSSVNLSGTYSATDVTPTVITLAAPNVVNAAWTALAGPTAYTSPRLSTAGEGWVGPFVVDMADADTIVINVAAPQGMYYVTQKGKDKGWYADILFEVTPVSATGVPTGAATTQTVRIQGDGKDKAPRGQTLEYALPAPGLYRIRGRRTTPKDSATVKAALGIKVKDEGTIVDEVQWREAYGTALITEPHFGDVTTIFSRTFATAFATAQKERKLTCRATRKVYERNLDDTFGPGLVASRNAADILCHMVLDPYIGGRPATEIDVPLLYATAAQVVEYFGVTDAADFSYTFDQDNLSAEEMIQSVAQAVFCTAYRQGSVLRLYFERATLDSVLLFNHRNKAPGSETRTIRFGRLNNYDGVELDYTTPDGTVKTIYVPDDRSATKPKKLQLDGIVDRRGDAAIPTIHAKRAWNKIRYQHTTAEFTALAEATQLIRTQRIEVVDNTRPDVIDGEVRGQDGLVLQLSQPFEPVAGLVYAIFLQMRDGSIEGIDVAAGPTSMSCTLLAAPSQALVLGDDAWALTTYQIVGSDRVRPSAMLVVEKGAFSKHQVTLQAVNYDDRYYADDNEFRAV